MTGRKTSVTARFRELVECNKLLNVHCVSTTSVSLKIYTKTATEYRDFKKLQKRQKKRVIRTMKKTVQTHCLSLDIGMEALKNIRGLPNLWEP